MNWNKNIEVFNEDCMLTMARYEDNHFDLAIVDPPYGIDADKKNNGKNSDRHEKTAKAKINTYQKTNWDSEIPNKEYFDELKRVSKKQIIWGANYFGLTAGMLYWHKNVTMPSYSTGELASLSWLTKNDFIELTWNGMLQHNMKDREQRIHPTQKPISLYQRLLIKYADKGSKILDTHFGGGSHGIALDSMNKIEKMDLTLVACEIDADYYNDAKKRFENKTSQLVIF